MDLSPVNSIASSEYTWSSDMFEPVSNTDQAFEENLKQLDAIVQLVLVPLLGKYLGRRFAHSLWSSIAWSLYRKKFI